MENMDESNRIDIEQKMPDSSKYILREYSQ